MDDYVERLTEIGDSLEELLGEMEDSGLITESMSADIEAITAAMDAISAAVEGLSPPGNKPETDTEADPAAETDTEADPAAV